MTVRLTGTQLFWLTHVGLAVWAAVVVTVAVAADDYGYIGLFFAPALAVKWT